MSSIVDDSTITLPGMPAMTPVARKYCRAFFDGSPRLEARAHHGRAVGHLLAPRDEEEETCRGLSIVTALATRSGHDATREGQTMWAEVSWADP